MRDFRSWTLALAALTLWGTPARPAEDEKLVPEEGAVQIMLLRQKSVQDELKLDADETRKIHDFTAQQWKKLGEFDNLGSDQRHQKFAELTRENDRFIDQVLEPPQRKRLHEITLQMAGLLWLSRPEVASELKLTDEQKEKVKRIQRRARREAEELVHAQSPQQREAKVRELRVTSRKRLFDVLTDEQEAKWEAMTGKPFHGPIHFDRYDEDAPGK